MKKIYLILSLLFVSSFIFGQTKPQQLDKAEEGNGPILILGDEDSYNEYRFDTSFCVGADLNIIYENIKDSLNSALDFTQTLIGACGGGNTYQVIQEVIGDTIFYYHMEFGPDGVPTGTVDTTFSCKDISNPDGNLMVNVTTTAVFNGDSLYYELIHTQSNGDQDTAFWSTLSPIIVSTDTDNVIIVGSDGGAFVDCSKIKSYEFIDTVFNWDAGAVVTFTSLVPDGTIADAHISVNGAEQGEGQTMFGFTIVGGGENNSITITTTEAFGSATDPCTVEIHYVVENDCCP